MMCTEQNASVRANNCTRSCSKKTLARLESFTFFHQFPTGRAGKIRKIQLLMLACILRAFLRMKLLRGQLQIDGGKRLRYTYDSHVSRSYQNRVPSNIFLIASYCYISLLSLQFQEKDRIAKEVERLSKLCPLSDTLDAPCCHIASTDYSGCSLDGSSWGASKPGTPNL